MASLLARIFPGTVRADMCRENSSTQTSGQTATTAKSAKRQSSRLKARRSITSLFGTATKIVSSEQRPVTTVDGTASCREAQHYPLYDQTNPEHEPRALCSELEQSPTANKKRFSGSPTNSTFWKRPASPGRPPSTTGPRSRLQGFADTLRAKATMFYEAHEASSGDDAQFHEVPMSLTPWSPKTFSKKSVRFRSGDSVINHAQPQGSPILAHSMRPPSLSLADLPSMRLFDNDSEEFEIFSQTAGNQSDQPFHVPSPSSLEETNQTCFPEIETKYSLVNLFSESNLDDCLCGEDSFYDPAPASRRECSSCRHSTFELYSGKDYVSDDEGNTGSKKGKAARIRGKESHVQSTRDLFSDRSELSTSSEHSLALKNRDDVSRNSHQDARRRCGLTILVSPTLETPKVLQRAISETQYDADNEPEPSDSREAQNESLEVNSVQLDYNSRRIYARSTGESDFGSDLVRSEKPAQVGVVSQDKQPEAGSFEPGSALLVDLPGVLTRIRSKNTSPLTGFDTSSPAEAPRHFLAEVAVRSMSPSDSAHDVNRDTSRSPFKDRGLPDAGFSVLERYPEMLTQKLRSEGINPALWKQLGLPHKSAPSVDQSPYDDEELSTLHCAISARAQSLSDSAQERSAGRSVSEDSSGPAFESQFLKSGKTPIRSQVSAPSSHAHSQSIPAATVPHLPQGMNWPTMNVEPAADQMQCTGIRIGQMRLETSSITFEGSTAEALPDLGRKSSFSCPGRLTEDLLEASAETECHAGATSTSSQLAPVQEGLADTMYQNTSLLGILVPIRKRSSDSSHETNATIFSTMPSVSASSSVDDSSWLRELSEGMSWGKQSRSFTSNEELLQHPKQPAEPGDDANFDMSAPNLRCDVEILTSKLGD